MSSFLLTCALLLPAADDAVDPARLDDGALAARADAAFAEGVSLREDEEKAVPRFRDAAACYEELRRRGVRNPTLARNLGNALLLADDLAGAILSYRRGLRLAPRDEELRSSLEAARAQVTAPPVPMITTKPSAWTLIPPDGWFGGAALLYALACVGVLRWRMTRRTAPLWSAGIGLLAAAALVGGGTWAGHVARGDARPVVVIAADGTTLRQGNATAYPPRLDAGLNAGVEAVLLLERDGWRQIELPNGVVGWVPAECALVERDE